MRLVRAGASGPRYGSNFSVARSEPLYLCKTASMVRNCRSRRRRIISLAIRIRGGR